MGIDFSGFLVLGGFLIVWAVLLLLKRQQVNNPEDQDGEANLPPAPRP